MTDTLVPDVTSEPGTESSDDYDWAKGQQIFATGGVVYASRGELGLKCPGDSTSLA